MKDKNVLVVVVCRLLLNTKLESRKEDLQILLLVECRFTSVNGYKSNFECEQY